MKSDKYEFCLFAANALLAVKLSLPGYLSKLKLKNGKMGKNPFLAKLRRPI